MSGFARRWLIGIAMLGCAMGTSSTGCAAEPQGLDYLAIQQAFLREEFETVALSAQQFLDRRPQAPERSKIWLWRILSLDRLQRSNEALAELEQLKAALPADDALWPELLFWEGEVSRLSLQLVRARFAYQRLLERYPRCPWVAQAELGMAFVAIQQHGWEIALQHLQAIAVHPSASPSLLRDAQLLEGFCDLQLQRFSEARAVLEPVLRGADDAPAAKGQAAFYLGESLSGLGRFEEAARLYRLAINGSPSSGLGQASQSFWWWSASAQFGLGWALYRAGRCEESVEVFDQYLAQATQPEHDREAWFAQGSCLIQRGQTAAALDRFTRVVARQSDDALALESGLWMASLYREHGEDEQARPLLERLLATQSDPRARARIQLPLGSLRLAAGAPAEAEAYFLEASGSDDLATRQAAMNGLGDVQLFLGRLEDAIRRYEDASALAPETSAGTYAAYQLGRVHLQRGALDAAAEAFESLADHPNPSVADDARLALAAVYLSRHRNDSAQALLDTVRQSRAGTPAAGRAAYYHALMALETTGEAEASRWAEEAIALAPSSDEAFDARLLLLDLRARDRPARELIASLRQLADAPSLSRSQLAKLAKRLGELTQEAQLYAEAMFWYEAAARWMPSLKSEIAYRIASCYEEGGDVEVATRWYQRIEQPPWRVRGLLAAGKLFERQERLGQAETIYRQLAAEPIPEAKVAREHLAALHLATQ